MGGEPKDETRIEVDFSEIKRVMEELKNSEKGRKKEEKEEFTCRVCGCNEYEGIYKTDMFTPIGGKIYPSGFKCKGCSVMFDDPQKWSLKKKHYKKNTGLKKNICTDNE